MEVERSDALYAVKQHALAALGLQTLDRIDNFDDLLRAARVICLSEEELYFVDGASVFQHSLNPRNEAAALSLLLACCPPASADPHCQPARFFQPKNVSLKLTFASSGSGWTSELHRLCDNLAPDHNGDEHDAPVHETGATELEKCETFGLPWFSSATNDQHS